MSCSHTRLLQRLAVEDPETLKTDPWRRHLQGCRACRQVQNAYDRSLAVFCQLETERLSKPLGSSWEAFSARLERHRNARQRRNWRLTVSAAAAAVLVATGGMVYETAGGLSPHPARIVRLRPEEQQQLARALHQSLNGGSWVRYALSESGDNARGEGAKAAKSPGVGLPPLQLVGGLGSTVQYGRKAGLSASLPMSAPVFVGGSLPDINMAPIVPASAPASANGLQHAPTHSIPIR